MFGFSLFSSLILGSALGRAISNFLVYSLGVNFLDNSVGIIPSFTQELALTKTFDLLDFGLTIVFTLASFAIFHYQLKLKNKLLALASLIFSFVLFLQVHFAAYNLFHVLIFIFAFYAILFGTRKAKLNDIGSTNLFVLANGVLTGFYLLLVINNFTTTILPLSALGLVPIAYSLLPVKYFKSQAHLALILSVLAPTSLTWLLIIGVVTLLMAPTLMRNNNFIFKTLYPISFIALLVYNPLYYLGPFDSVEEGFWLGWLAGMKDGKVLYRDIAAYHPPVIIWIVSIFNNTRLVLHLLQIFGVIFYFFLAKKLLKNKLAVFVVMLVAIALTTIMVRNNVEIRLGMGLVSLAMLTHPMAAGALAALSLFTSVEVGVAVLAAGGLAVLLYNRKSIFKYLAGFLAVSVPIVAILALQGGLIPMIEQISTYASAFSSGYLNLPAERSVNSAFIHWHIINQYISAYPFLWELARAGIVGAIMVALHKREKLALAVGIFGLILFRSALGRSDFYHLLLPLLVAIPLIFFALEKFENKYLVPVFSFLLLFVFARNIVNASFVETKLYQLQTYGKQIGEPEPVFAESELTLVNHIKQNTLANESIFVYPWNPEIYYLAERPNATKFYTPYAFFSDKYQQEMISELQSNKPAMIIYNPEMKFADLVPDSLPLVNRYILENFEEVVSFGNYKILVLK